MAAWLNGFPADIADAAMIELWSVTQQAFGYAQADSLIFEWNLFNYSYISFEKDALTVAAKELNIVDVNVWLQQFPFIGTVPAKERVVGNEIVSFKDLFTPAVIDGYVGYDHRDATLGIEYVVVAVQVWRETVGQKHIWSPQEVRMRISSTAVQPPLVTVAT